MWRPRDDPGLVTKQDTRGRRQARPRVADEALPKDHLPPDSERAGRTDPPDGPPPEVVPASQAAQRTPGEAGVGVRPHLEGSEQGPQ